MFMFIFSNLNWFCKSQTLDPWTDFNGICIGSEHLKIKTFLLRSLNNCSLREWKSSRDGNKHSTEIKFYTWILSASLGFQHRKLETFTADTWDRICISLLGIIFELFCGNIKRKKKKKALLWNIKKIDGDLTKAICTRQGFS